MYQYLKLDAFIIIELYKVYLIMLFYIFDLEATDIKQQSDSSTGFK